MMIQAEIEWVLSMGSKEFDKLMIYHDDLPVRKRVALKLFKRYFKELDDDRARTLPALEVLAPYLLGTNKAGGQNNINLPNITPEALMVALARAQSPELPAAATPIPAKTLPKPAQKHAKGPSRADDEAEYHEHEP